MTNLAEDDVFSKRQQEIITQVSKNGYVTIEALAAQFDVSAQTVRRDIIELSQYGRVQRFHGGAGPVDSAESARLDYQEKQTIGKKEKAAVGQKTAAMIPDGSTVYLDVGTTIEACAFEMSKRPGFTIFTNSMPTAMIFDPDKHQVFVLGGKIAGRDGSLVGENVVQTLKDLHLDFALIGCSAIDESGRVMDFDMAKIAGKRAAMSIARKSFLLSTLSKFNKTALAAISHIDDFDNVITEDS